MTTYTDEERQKAIQSLLKRRERAHQYVLERKEEKADYQRQYREEHGEELVAYRRQYREEHSEEIAEYMRQYREEHREERDVYNRQHREEKAGYDRRYYLEHPGKMAERMRQYHKEHPELRKAARSRRRALIVDSNGHFTAEEFRLLCEAYENKCIYCQEELPLTPDHAIPLSRGGSNSIDNIVPSCESCNKRKSAMTYDEFMERLLTEEVVRIT